MEVLYLQGTWVDIAGETTKGRCIATGVELCGQWKLCHVMWCWSVVNRSLRAFNGSLLRSFPLALRDLLRVESRGILFCPETLSFSVPRHYFMVYNTVSRLGVPTFLLSV